MDTCETKQRRLRMVYETAYDGVSLDLHHLLCWVMPWLVDVLAAWGAFMGLSVCVSRQGSAKAVYACQLM